MLGFGKKKAQIRSVEDYIESLDGQKQIVENKPPRISGKPTRTKSFAVALLIILAALVLVVVMFSKIAALSSEVAALRTQLVASTSLQPRLDRLEEEFGTFKTRMAERQTPMMQQESRETAVKKAPLSRPRKKTAKPKT